MHGDTKWKAGLAQLVEQLIRNEQVKGSSPFIGFYGLRNIGNAETTFLPVL